MPAWARAAAAVFLIGAGLGLANVQVRSDANGLSISTGWMRPAASATDRVVQGSGGQVREAQGLATTAGTSEAPASRLELAALEADLRRELQTIQASHTGASPASESRMSVDDQAVLRRVQSLIAESERRQEQEFARRLTQFTRETEMQRRADLVRLEQGFGRFEAQRGAQAVRQQQMLDYLYRVSTSKVP
jgi:hypothetical protein